MGIIQDLVSKEPNIFKNERGKLILEATEKFGCTYKTIYKYLKRYWQRGKVKDSLLPDYKNCGNKGNKRTGTEIKPVDLELQIALELILHLK